MKYLLDTCVISELVKKEPHPSVIRWMDTGDESKMYLSVLTLGEIIKGINKLPNGDRREKLPVVDSLIAASANVHDLIVVTRNVKDMERCRTKVFNPWEAQ